MTNGHLIVKIHKDPSFKPPRIDTTPRPSTTLRKVASRTSSRIFIVEKVSEDQLSQSRRSSLGINIRPSIGTLGSISSIASNSDTEGLQIKHTAGVLALCLLAILIGLIYGNRLDQTATPTSTPLLTTTYRQLATVGMDLITII